MPERAAPIGPDAGGAVGWLLVAEPAVPAGDAWLGPDERRVLAGLRVAKRRREWRLGRHAAKQAVRAWLGEAAPAAEVIEIRAAEDGAPEAWHGEVRWPVSISISHRAGLALCAVSGPERALGCDLEQVEAHSEAFVRDYFTVEERAFIAAGAVGGGEEAGRAGRALRATLLWSAKECALKALRTGLRRDTRSVVVAISPVSAEASWQAFTVRDRDAGQVFYGHWRPHLGDVMTVVAEPPAGPPVGLSGA